MNYILILLLSFLFLITHHVISQKSIGSVNIQKNISPLNISCEPFGKLKKITNTSKAKCKGIGYPGL